MLHALYTIFTSFLRMAVVSIDSISPEDALARVGDARTVFIDVREPGEYKHGHIPGARLYPLMSGVLEQRWSELPEDRPMVVYCRSAGRSAIACTFLSDHGFKKIQNLSGGFVGYQKLPNARVETGGDGDGMAG
jgi:hydroxyacylglutathione hydrolase